MSCSKTNILLSCCKECVLKENCFNACEEKNQSICGYYVDYESPVKCIFISKIKEVVELIKIEEGTEEINEEIMEEVAMTIEAEDDEEEE